MGHEYRNAFTAVLNQHLVAKEKKIMEKGYMDGSYFYIDFTPIRTCNSYLVSFRHPGATRGHVKINKDTAVIEDIKFYDTAYGPALFCYKRSVKEAVESEFLDKPMPDLLEKVIAGL